MKSLAYVVISLSLLSLACAREHPTMSTASESGSAKITVKLGAVGSLAKRATIDLDTLTVTLSAPDEDTIVSRTALGGNSQQSVIATFGGLACSKTWAARVEARDKSARTTHSGAANFQVDANDTVPITVDLAARFSMLKANFFPIRDSVNACILSVDGIVVADSSFGTAALRGDTVGLAYDYLAANPEGVSHAVSLDARGVFLGEDTLLYHGDTTITVVSGRNASYALKLKSASLNPPTGAAIMTVVLGAIGTVTVNGEMEFSGALYVDSAATGANTGDNWQNAFTDLQQAINQAPGGSAVYVARGTYFPSASDRSASFMLKSGIKIYGRYPNHGGTRNMALRTILSGDIQRDGDSSNNSYTIVKAENADTSCLMDGLTIQCGNGAEKGAGMQILQSSPTIANCIFSGNRSTGSGMDTASGAAVYSSGGSPLLTDCLFEGNVVFSENCGFGGAVYLAGGTCAKCSFTANVCYGTNSASGGALLAIDATATDCTFDRNSCTASNSATGGALHTTRSMVTNCTFSGNNCQSEFPLGGAIHLIEGAATHCTFTGNSSDAVYVAVGGAGYTEGGTITNCIFWHDTAFSDWNLVEGPEISGSATTIRNCIVQGGLPTALGPIFTENPLLGGLVDNGGPVKTHSIDPAGPARNTGTASVPSGVDATRDARGYLRSDGLPDIGAFEVR